ncbi:phenylacetate--CoA ligase [Candidatus Poribacteria bacterium]|nr:phenylacetate--CoA ligase [Candidatus Poribacteria bacterium]
MGDHDPEGRERLDRERLTQAQLSAFRGMLGPVLDTNAFYRTRLATAGVIRPQDIASLDDLRRLPFTTRRELTEDQAARPPYGTLLTFSPERYTRDHRTSGTTGRPLRWLDTPASWEWLVESWAAGYRAADVGPEDRIFLAFSFGPFIGLWCAFEAARRVGAMAIPGGGASTEQRARLMADNAATVLVSTPTYALHLADIARAKGIPAMDAVRVTIHGGEPGASIPATKRRIADTWGATCFDHAGATEVGSWGFECGELRGLHINESEFIVEVLNPRPDEPEREGELVLTNLGRVGMPLIRYRTGDHVRLASDPCPCGRTYVRLDGGVTGRVDDAMLIRGIVVFPAALENAIRSVPQVSEYAIDVDRRGALDELRVRVEAAAAGGSSTADVAESIRRATGLRAQVTRAEVGSLPRHELKSRRVVDHR